MTAPRKCKASSKPWPLPVFSRPSSRIQTRLSVSFCSPLVLLSITPSYLSKHSGILRIRVFRNLHHWSCFILLAAVRAKNSQHNKKVIRNLPQIPSLKMNHLSPTNAAAGGTMITPTNNQRNQGGGIQSLTIETGS